MAERVYQPLPPERHWAARARFVGGGLVYVVAILVALFNAIASFVLIALVAVYYIVERTPAYPGADRRRQRPAGALRKLPRWIVAIKQVSEARLG